MKQLLWSREKSFPNDDQIPNETPKYRVIQYRLGIISCKTRADLVIYFIQKLLQSREKL